MFQALRKEFQYVRNVCTCGFLAPAPEVRGTRLLNALARFVAFIQVGEIRIHGRENLNRIQAPYIITSNHPHYADAAIIPILINGPARYMTARGVIQFAWGLTAMIAGRVGAFAVDLDEGRGAPALRAAVRVLTSNQRLVMFPEGWAHMDGQMREFKKGTVAIAKAASRKMNHAVNIVPVFISYGRYPGTWINKLNPRLQYLFTLFCFWRYRCGVNVVVGKAIPSSLLPACNDMATEVLRTSIIALDPGSSETVSSP